MVTTYGLTKIHPTFFSIAYLTQTYYVVPQLIRNVAGSGTDLSRRPGYRDHNPTTLEHNIDTEAPNSCTQITQQKHLL